MALRHHTTLDANQENINSKLAVKSALIQLAKPITKRPALGEVGNKLQSITCNQNGAVKKFGVMGPPQAVTKKTVTGVHPKKDVVEKKPTDKSVVGTKPQQKKQESLIKSKADEDKAISSTHSTKSYSSKQLTIIDPDEGSNNEPQMVTEYLGDIFSYLRDLENKFLIRENFLDGHETTPRMRAILVNWLVEVHLNFKLYLETLHLCVSIVDRYIQDNKNVGRSTLQLVGTAAMFVASKYEEMYIPDLSDFVYICDDTFSNNQILRMEMEILKKLDFSFGRPLSVHFLRRYNKIAQVRSDHHTLGKYILELALLEVDMCHIKPSIQAAAACCLSIAILNDVMDLRKVWTPTMVHYTTYEFADFRSVIIDLAQIVVKSEQSKYQTIRKKYAAANYAKISLNPKLNGPLVKKLMSTKK